MDKGARVEIVKGRKGKGVVGTVFWIGDDKYNPGKKRLGIHGDDGETWWVSADNVEKSDATAPEASDETFERGDKVRWKEGDEAGIGEVFWTGPSRIGPGMRLGVNCDDGETRWFDGRLVERVDDGAASSGGPPADAPRMDTPLMDAPPPDDEPPPTFDEAPPPTDAAPDPGEPPAMDEPPPPEEPPADWDDEDPPF